MSTSNKAFTGLKTDIQSALASSTTTTGGVDHDIERLTFTLNLEGRDTTSVIVIAKFLGADKLIIGAHISGIIPETGVGVAFVIGTIDDQDDLVHHVTPSLTYSEVNAGRLQRPTNYTDDSENFLLSEITTSGLDIGLFIKNGHTKSAKAHIVLDLVVINV